MNYQNDDLRIKEINELLPPVALLEKFPATENAANTVSRARKAIHKILKGNDDRLLVVIGPCSIHDPAAAKEYASRLLALREELKDSLEIVMRVYFEKTAHHGGLERADQRSTYGSQLSNQRRPAHRA
jgi:3-deoxy-D-arabinoheptulosonate-7-phosphate synthase (EC 2.5.1.54)